MISSDDMRKPLRAIEITFGPTNQDEVIHQLRQRAFGAQFASRVSEDPAHAGDRFLQFYRQDMKLIGQLRSQAATIDLVLYRNNPLGETKQAYDFVVRILRDGVMSVPTATFKETIFLAGDDATIGRDAHLVANLSARIGFPKSKTLLLTDALATFAENQRMAILFRQIGPDPQHFNVDMYREDVMLHAANGLGTDPMHMSISRAGDRSVSDATLAATFTALKQAVEAVPGVTFTLKP